jgi:polyisoprenoid-binding protein YceI
METTQNAVQTTWALDAAHSELLFKVKHLMIANVKGEFRKFTASIEGEDFRTSKITVRVETGSVFTNQEDRDNHLRSADFFDSENHPEMLFESTSITEVKDSEYNLKGLLTIRGISKEVSLKVEFGGINKDPWGNQKAGFSVEGSINRKDWNLNWNAALETGGVLVSDEVKISGEIQFAKQA